MTKKDTEVIIIGAGLSGLACGKRLAEAGHPFLILEADNRIGGRIKTDEVDGFQLDHGFQVLQTSYPEVRKQLDLKRLNLHYFAPGAIFRINGRFHRIADPFRLPRHIPSTLTAPIGSFRDRLRIIQLAIKLGNTSVSDIFTASDQPTSEFLKEEGFSETMINRFFRPFYATASLDPDIKSSSRVFKYLFRIFTAGQAALPANGMAEIPKQLSETIPSKQIRLNSRVESLIDGGVKLQSGEEIHAPQVVIATEGPQAERLLKSTESTGSVGEYCFYFATENAPLNDSFLVLNGEDQGLISSLTIPTNIAAQYAPDGMSLVSVVVLRSSKEDEQTLKQAVISELTDWFGSEVANWHHLPTYYIPHALPRQVPPLADPTVSRLPPGKGIYLCGEHGSVPGNQWALLSGIQVANQVMTAAGLIQN